MNLTITGYSTAMFSTWYFVDELNLLFDCGDGLSAGLLQKGRKVKHAFISHADRDHLTGLFQFLQLNSRPGFPVIHYPKDSGSFPAIREFMNRFDGHCEYSQWVPVEDGSEIRLPNNLVVRAIENGHVKTNPPLTKSLSYKVYSTKRKLKAEFHGMPGQEIGRLKKELGDDHVTEEVRSNILSFSGDTPVEDPARWDGSEILIHEATFLDAGVDGKLATERNQHSLLEQVIEMVSSIEVGQLILGHFSVRYSPEQIDRAILDLCDKYGLDTPVYRVLPGEVGRDVLGGTAVNA